MKNTRTNLGLTTLALATFAGAANAGIAGGDVYQMNQRGEVTATFLSSSAGATGSLYFLGHKGSGDEAITYAASTDAFGLGQFVFSNKGTPANTGVGLGQFNAGDSLFFAYIITKGSGNAQKDSFARNDLAADVDFFRTNSSVATDYGSYSIIGVEDIFLRNKSDFDYNDMLFALRVDAVPTPGAGLLAAMGGIVAFRRKRH